MKALSLWCSASAVASLFLQFQAHGADGRYFGYWGLGAIGKTDYIKTVREVDTVWVYGGGPTKYSAWNAKIEEAKANGQSVVLMINYSFFQVSDSKRLPFLISNARNYWDAFYLNVVLPHRESVAAINIGDEPYWNNQKLPSPAPSSTVKAHLEALAAYIKKSDPTLKTVLTLSSPEIDQGYGPPRGVDWVGINCYYFLKDYCPYSLLTRRYEVLRRKLNPSQKLIFTMDAWKSPGTGAPTASDQDAVLTFNNAYADYIFAHKDQTAGVFPFVFQNFPDGGTNYGAQSMPRVRYWLKTFGQYYSSGKPIVIPSGVFRSRQDGVWNAYAANAETYCKFETLSNLDTLVKPGLKAGFGYLNAVYGKVEYSQRFVGTCNSTLSPMVEDLSLVENNRDRTSVRWKAQSLGARYAAFVVKVTDKVPSCVLGALKPITKNEVSFSKLLPGTDYLVRVCAMEPDLKIWSQGKDLFFQTPPRGPISGTINPPQVGTPTPGHL